MNGLRSRYKTGEEPFGSGGENLPVTLLDYWKWAYSDLMNNLERGRLAEFLVAHALDIIDKPRLEWDEKDLKKDGIPIEVKSSAYLQSWKQNGLYTVSFRIEQRSSDIYVFCILTEEDKTLVDPMNVDQWKFCVVSTDTIKRKLPKQKTIRENPIQYKLGGKWISYKELKYAVCQEILNIKRQRKA